MMQVINIIGNLALALCALPLAIQAYRFKKISIDLPFLILWTLGEVCVMMYTMSIKEWALVGNYSVNTICLLIIWRYRK